MALLSRRVLNLTTSSSLFPAVPYSMLDLSFLTRDQTHRLHRKADSLLLDHQGSPKLTTSDRQPRSYSHPSHRFLDYFSSLLTSLLPASILSSSEFILPISAWTFRKWKSGHTLSLLKAVHWPPTALRPNVRILCLAYKPQCSLAAAFSCLPIDRQGFPSSQDLFT